MCFEKLGLSGPLLEALAKAGFTTPTDIQKEAIPLILAGHDVIARSPTGTGKTLAYLLPLLEKLDPERREAQAIVLAPTHELAVQIHRQAAEIAEHGGLKITSMPVIGGVNIDRQTETLKKTKPQLLTGSAGRVLELIQKRKITAPKIRTIVLDEADRLLDGDNIETVRAVIKTTLKDRQLLMVSAAMPPGALMTARAMMNNPRETAGASVAEVPAGIAHWYFLCQERDKIETLKKLTHHLKIEKALVFINNSHGIETTLAKLTFHGLQVSALFGAANKTDRQTALEHFRRGKTHLLLTSDLGARGLDIPDTPYIFSLQMPEEPSLYLHRAGRTGRAGQKGTAISIITKNELPLLTKTEKTLNITILPKITAHAKILDAKKPT